MAENKKRDNGQPSSRDAQEAMALPKRNVLWIVVGFAIMVLGYILLSGGGAKTPSEFSDAIFSFRRLYIAPIVMIGGAVVVIVAILKKSKPKD